MLYFIGLGLADERDISVRGLECIKGCSKLYLENYTSVLRSDHQKLESFYGKPVIVSDRESVELHASRMIEEAKNAEIGFLVVGDPFGYGGEQRNQCRATTHSDLLLRAHKMGVKIRVIHNASILNAVGECGLQLYNFGKTVSIPFFTEKWRPDSFYEKIAENDRMLMHTLCLLDIKVKEQSEENLFKGRLIYEPPRFMTATQAVQQLVEIEDRLQQNIITPDRVIVVIARIGAEDQLIATCTVGDASERDFGAPLHSLIIPCRSMHEMEKEVLNIYRL